MGAYSDEFDRLAATAESDAQTRFDAFAKRAAPLLDAIAAGVAADGKLEASFAIGEPAVEEIYPFTYHFRTVTVSFNGAASGRKLGAGTLRIDEEIPTAVYPLADGSTDQTSLDDAVKERDQIIRGLLRQAAEGAAKTSRAYSPGTSGF